jgi:hypothetical protein
MIYDLSNAVLVPGKMAEYWDIAQKELHPLYPKLGMKSVGSFHAYTGNMNQTYTLYVFNDLAAVQQVREAQRQSEEYRNVSAKMNALRISMTTTLLEPNPWSPMK